MKRKLIIRYSKKPAIKAGLFRNLAPLTGIAVAINWLIGKLKQKIEIVKATRLTTFFLVNMN
ncbi:hypothetical protein BFF42_18770 [Shigella sp. FC1661]|nr:hypothetical protein BFF42_18770 [Shigella sp. FC1661]